MRRMVDLRNGLLLRIMAGFLLVYAVAAYETYAPSFILVLNGLSMSVASGVCVAYAPVFLGALVERHPSKGDYLGTGIFLVSCCILGMRGLSVVARDLGWPDIYNTNFMTAVMATGLIGGLLHLWAPNAVEGHLPRARWVSTGIVFAVGFFLTFALWTASQHGVPHPPVELR